MGQRLRPGQRRDTWGKPYAGSRGERGGCDDDEWHAEEVESDAELERAMAVPKGGGAGAAISGRLESGAHSDALGSAVRQAAAAPTTLLDEHHHPLPRPEVSSSSEGKVRVSFAATRCERLLLHVAVVQGAGGEREEFPLRGSPFSVDVLPAPTSARRCEAFGDALHTATVRQSTSFVILARDAHGNRRNTGGERFVVSFRGPCNPVARVADRGDGTYRVTYVAAVSGSCSMAVTLNRQHVVGSPFPLNVDGPRPAAQQERQQQQQQQQRGVSPARARQEYGSHGAPSPRGAPRYDRRY